MRRGTSGAGARRSAPRRARPRRTAVPAPGETPVRGAREPAVEGPVFPGPGTERASAALPSVRIVSTTSLETTGHLVCDGCGRIVRWRVPELTQRELAEVAISSPEGWAVRSLAVSFTGTCSSCRRGTGTVG